jgi:hypothetical protein
VLVAAMTIGALFAPHRVAEELLHETPQSAEWRRGARNTRDAVYTALPLLASTFVALVLLALIPVRRRSQ